MKHFTQEDIAQKLTGWAFVNNGIEKDFTFKDFNEAFAFMTRIALWCAIEDHHPEWSNIYNKVHIRLNAHSENAVTEKDINLARKIDAAFS